MVNSLLIQGRALAAPLALFFARAQAWADGLLMPVDGAPPVEEGQPGSRPSSGLPGWAIALIGVAVVICLIPVCFVLIITILTLLGPAIGNVFSSTVDGI